MSEIVIGTTNVAKARQCELALAGTGIGMQRISDVLPTVPEIAEVAAGPTENAARKATAYANLVGRPVVSLDYALFFDGVDAEEQPGANVRRIPGGRGRPSDHELLSYYAELFDRYGGSVHGRWQAGIAGATPAGEVARETAEVGRTFVSKPCAARVPGFPLASLQLVGERYVAELDERREAALIRETLCHPLVTVVEQVLSPRALGERRS